MLKSIGNPSTRYGDQTISGGNLVIGTAGNGIDFSADSHAAGMTSELFDDYEEGTWTPSYGGSGSNPSPTYLVRDARYTKIGRTVFWTAEITITATSGGSGILQITGFPFACGYRYAGGATITYANNWTVAAPSVGTMFNGASSVNLGSNAALTFTDTSVANLTNGVVYLIAYGSYTV